MPDYRAYFLGPDGRISGFEAYEAASDAAAIERAKLIESDRDMEIWCGARFVKREKHPRK